MNLIMNFLHIKLKLFTVLNKNRSSTEVDCFPLHSKLAKFNVLY